MAIERHNPELSDRPCGCPPGTVCTKCFGKPAPAKPRPIAREHPEWAYVADCACSVCNEFWTAFKENHDGADPPAKVPAKVECLVCGAGLAAPPGESLEHNLCAAHALATPDLIATAIEVGKTAALCHDRSVEASQRKRTNKNLRGVFG